MRQPCSRRALQVLRRIASPRSRRRPRRRARQSGARPRPPPESASQSAAARASARACRPGRPARARQTCPGRTRAAAPAGRG
eukprot:1294556-Pleurochrysis_carterae.AAC.1